MKPKTMILMCVAVGCGLVASILTSRLIADRGQAGPEEKKVKVLIAKQKIPVYTALNEPEKMFVEKEVPESAAPKRGIRSFDELRGKKVNRQLNEESYVTTDDIVSKESDGLGSILPPGKRAVAIRVNPESLAGGFVLPNSRVDIVWTSRAGDAISQTILQNMLILAVDQMDNHNPEQRAMLGSTVTLAVTQEEAQELSIASATGELRLTLRGIGDKEHVALKESTQEDLRRPDQGKNGDNQGQNNPGGTAGGTGFPEIPEVDSTPAVVLKPEKDPKSTAPEKDPKPKAKPLQKHTLTIISGESVVRHVFVKDKKDTKWASDGKRKGATTEEATQPPDIDEPKEETKPEPTVDPEADPTETDTENERSSTSTPTAESKDSSNPEEG